MDAKDDLKRSIGGLKRALRRAAADAKRSGSGTNVNVTGRRNIVVSGNVGGAGETHAASSRQDVGVQQGGGGQETAVVEMRESSSEGPV